MSRIFYTPPVTRNLLIINAIMFLAMLVFGARGADLNNLMGLHFFLANDFHLYQFVTYMFMHANFEHIFFNMFALWMFGRTLEAAWGGKRYLLFYFVCGIGAGLCQEVWQFGQYAIEGLAQYDGVNTGSTVIPMADYLDSWTTVGASGAIYGVLLGFGMSYPEEPILIFPIPVPIKAKWFVAVYAVIEVFSAFLANDNTAHFAHLGGMLFAYLLLRHWRHAAQRQTAWSGWNNYSPPRKGFTERAREFFSHKRAAKPHFKDRQQDYDDNAQQQSEQEEIDKILEKVRRSGYSSLTDEEKEKLFNQSKRG